MADLPNGISQKDLDRYVQLDKALKKAQEEHKALNERIKQAFEDAGVAGKRTLIFDSAKFGSIVVKLGETRRLDSKALEEKYPFDKAPQYWRMQFDTTVVEEKILDQYRKLTQTLSVSTADE